VVPGGVIGEPGVVPGGEVGEPGAVPGGLIGEPGVVPGGGVGGDPGLVPGDPGKPPDGGAPGVVPDPGGAEPGLDCARAPLAPVIPIASRAITAIGLIIKNPLCGCAVGSTLLDGQIVGCR
jgi:hypothetical protein